MNRSRNGLLVGSMFVLVVLMLGLFGAQRAEGAARAALPTASNASSEPANCRFGAAYLGDYPGSDAWLPTLASGWTANFNIYDPELPATEYVFTVRLRQDKQNGERLDSYTFRIPLVDEYVDGNGQVQPGLGFFIRRAPAGSIWLIGNEIEIDNAIQDNIMPAVYARAYHEAYAYIKGIDPSARIAIGSVTMATPGRLQYLDIVLDTYRDLYDAAMPIDVWNLHIYLLPERVPVVEPMNADGKIALGTDPALAYFSSWNLPQNCPRPDQPDTLENDPRPDTICKAEHDSLRLFSDQVWAMRTWMKARGYQDRPLIISEFGSLFAYENGQPDGSCSERKDEFGRCMYPQRVAEFFDRTTDFMLNTKDPSVGYPADDGRLVQRWLWYSVYTGYLIGYSSNLLEDNFMAYAPGDPAALTVVGQAFMQRATADTHHNLRATKAAEVNVFVDQPGDRHSATLAVSFRNVGSRSITAPVAVTFYRDKALTLPITTTIVQPGAEGVAGCNWDNAPTVATGVWGSVGVGEHPYWAKIDSVDTVIESSENDNVVRGTVKVFALSKFGHRVFIPVGGRD